MTIAYGTTIFCDDIRQEESGKHIYIGVYNDAVVVHEEFPVIIPTFAFNVRILEKIDGGNSDIRIRITAPGPEGDEPVILEMDAPQERWNALQDPNSDPHAEYLTSNFMIKLSPFKVEQAGFIRVRAFKDGEEIKLGSAQVLHKDSVHISPIGENLRFDDRGFPGTIN